MIRAKRESDFAKQNLFSVNALPTERSEGGKGL